MKPHTILIVEDSPEVARVLQSVCESCGYSAVTASDAALARATFETVQPICVLLDLGLPDVDSGLSLMRELRSEFGRDAVIIVITGHTERDVHEEVWASGADHLITKPLRAEALQRILEPGSVPPPPAAQFDGKAL